MVVVFMGVAALGRKRGPLSPSAAPRRLDYFQGGNAAPRKPFDAAGPCRCVSRGPQWGQMPQMCLIMGPWQPSDPLGPSRFN